MFLLFLHMRTVRGHWHTTVAKERGAYYVEIVGEVNAQANRCREDKECEDLGGGMDFHHAGERRQTNEGRTEGEEDEESEDGEDGVCDDQFLSPLHTTHLKCRKGTV